MNTFIESKSSGEILRVPMLQCLKRVVCETANQLGELNKLVEQKTGKHLNLTIVSVDEKAADDFRIRVKGVTHSGRTAEEEFKVVWWNHTCSAHFHLFQWGNAAWGEGKTFLYNGVIESTSEVLAREIAIYTHGMQIPGVLSRR